MDLMKLSIKSCTNDLAHLKYNVHLKNREMLETKYLKELMRN